MTITLNVYNSIDLSDVMNIRMPWNYRLAVLGYYSALWKAMKPSLATIRKIDKRFMRVAIKREKGFTDRMVITLPSGLKMDTPAEMNKKDLKIIDLHLQALILAKS